jgi:virginiamycin B lyase
MEVTPVNKILSLLALLTFAGPLCYGATIAGTVKGPDGAPFEGAFVQAQNSKTRITVSVLSGKDGRYRVEKLPAGEYTIRIRAIGYTAVPQNGVNLSADQNAPMDFALQKGMVRWSDLSYYQGKELFPEGKGKAAFVRICLGCHGFETRMASVHRDADGWVDRVHYMKEVTRSVDFLHFTDENSADIAAYVNTLFGDASVLPKSPADLPGYPALVRHFGDEAMKIVYVEYDMPGPSRMPWDAFPAKDGKVWVPEFSPFDGIASLDPQTGKFEEYKEPEDRESFTHSAVATPDGTVWFTEQAMNKLGKWDPQTKEITEYQDVYAPGKQGLITGGSKHTVRVDSKGIVWASGAPFSSFDPKTKKFTDYPVAPNTYGVDIDKDDNVWFDGFTPNGKLFKVDGKTGKITGYQPPTAGLPRRIQADSDGIIWFAEYGAGKIGRFDPKTETFKEYTLPGPEASPYALGIDKNHYVWYSSEEMDVVGRLDPKTGRVLEYPFAQSENAMREFLPDSQGRMWFASPPNNKVGYFYLANGN